MRRHSAGAFYWSHGTVFDGANAAAGSVTRRRIASRRASERGGIFSCARLQFSRVLKFPAAQSDLNGSARFGMGMHLQILSAAFLH